MTGRRLAALLLVSQVTGCGSTLPPGEDPADLVSPQEIPAANPAMPAAAELLAAHLAATGMESVIRSSSSVLLRGTVRYEELDFAGDFEVVRARPARSRMTIWLPTMGAMVSGCDGELGWVQHPIVGSKLLEGVSLAKARFNAVYDHLLQRPDGLEVYVTVGRAAFAGQDCYEVFGLYDLPADLGASVAERSFREYYSVETGLLLGLVERSETSEGSAEVMTIFRDYEPFHGGLVATRTRQRSNGFELRFLVEEITYDAPVEELLAVPDEIRALVDG